MADIQKQFEQFHQNIRMDFEMSEQLREKRDNVVDDINSYLSTNNLPSATVLLQGSYKTKTGVKPIGDAEYDIDVGLRFGIDHEDYTHETVRNWVLEGTKSGARSVEEKKSCVRVSYVAGYHVDLVAYAVEGDSESSTYYLATNSEWSDADPKGLLDYIDEYRTKFEDTTDTSTQTDQFRRCVRALRRWIDILIPGESKDKPTGLAFILLAIQYGLEPKTFLDGRSDDLSSLLQFVQLIDFSVGRLTAIKPTPQYEDILGALNSDAMDNFKSSVGILGTALQEAQARADPVAACELMHTHFGDDFPIPDPEDTGRKSKAPAIVASSSSAAIVHGIR